MFQSISKVYNKMSNCGKIMVVILIFLVVVSILKNIKSYVKPVKEGMENEYKIVFKKGNEVYDDFYASIYDYLVFSAVKNEFEVGVIMNSGNPVKSSRIADIGCGTGHHVEMLNQKGLNVIGVDKSSAMIEMAKENCPSGNFIVGDALNNDLFKMDSLTHILCLYFTIYYIEDKQKFFNNAINWLMPGGYLYLHLVDREHFDPILPPGNPLYIVSPQKYASERITNTKVTFNNFVYSANFNLEKDKDIATFDEKFKYNDGKIRKQQQILYMEDTSDIVNMAQSAGFIIHSKFDMVNCGYERQFLYVFTKPS